MSIFLLLSKAELLEKYWASTQLRLPDILLHIWMNQWPPVFPPIIYQLLSKTDLGCIHDQNRRELFQSFSWYLGRSWEMIPKGMGYEYFSIIFMVFLPSYNPFRQKKYFYDLQVLIKSNQVRSIVYQNLFLVAFDPIILRPMVTNSTRHQKFHTKMKIHILSRSLFGLYMISMTNFFLMLDFLQRAG